jgi:hypothetical protein
MLLSGFLMGNNELAKKTYLWVMRCKAIKILIFFPVIHTLLKQLISFYERT